MRVSIRRLRERLSALLHLDDPPWRIALALAVGVFVSVTPFYGLHTLLSILVATVARLNKVATVTGAWLNLPWFAPFVYAAALKLGTAIVPDPDGSRRAWLALVLAQPSGLGWRDVLALLDHLSVTLLVGTTIVGAIAGVVTYVVAFWIISWQRTRRRAGSSAEDSRSRAA